ncbi:MAG: NlpC/P60 family protein [Pseudomonadota bacterium]
MKKLNSDIIIEQARAWLGTKFHHQGRLKRDRYDKGGCDCIGLIMGVSSELDIKSKQGGRLADYDQLDYNLQPDGHSLYENLAEHLVEIAISEIKKADILLFSFDKMPQHVAFYDYNSTTYTGYLIHCYYKIRCVTEHIYDKSWQDKLVTAFRFSQLC